MEGRKFPDQEAISHGRCESSPSAEHGGNGLSEDATFQAALSLALLSTSKQQDSEEEPGHKAKREDGITSPTTKPDENRKKRTHKSQDGKESCRRQKRRHKKHSRKYCGKKSNGRERKGRKFLSLTEENLAIFDTLNGDEPAQKKSKRLGSSNLNTPPSNDCSSAESKPRKKHKAIPSRDELASKIASPSAGGTKNNDHGKSRKIEEVDAAVATVSNETNSQWNSNNDSRHSFPSTSQNLDCEENQINLKKTSDKIECFSRGGSLTRRENEKNAAMEYSRHFNSSKISPTTTSSSNSGNSDCKRAEATKPESVEQGIIQCNASLNAYVDHSQERDINPSVPLTPPNRTVSFIIRLYILLSLRTDILHIKWMDHGRSWYLADPIEFELTVLPTYFGNSMSLTTFLRKVESHGFRRIRNAGFGGYSYYHEYFLRGLPWLCKHSFLKSKKGKSDKAKLSKKGESTGSSERGVGDAVTEAYLSMMSQLNPLPAEDPAYKLVLTSIDSYIRSQGPKARILTQFCTISYGGAPSQTNPVTSPSREAVSAVFGLPRIAEAAAESLSLQMQTSYARQDVASHVQNSSTAVTNQVAPSSQYPEEKVSETNSSMKQAYAQALSSDNARTHSNMILKNSIANKTVPFVQRSSNAGTPQSETEAEQQQLANSLFQIIMQSQRDKTKTNNASPSFSATNGVENQIIVPLMQTNTDLNQRQPNSFSHLQSIISNSHQNIMPTMHQSSHNLSQSQMHDTTGHPKAISSSGGHSHSAHAMGMNVGGLSHGAMASSSMHQNHQQQQHQYQQHQPQHQTCNGISLNPMLASSNFLSQPSHDILSFLASNPTALHEHLTRAMISMNNPTPSNSVSVANINSNNQLLAVGNNHAGTNNINNAVFDTMVHAARIGAVYGANKAKNGEE